MNKEELIRALRLMDDIEQSKMKINCFLDDEHTLEARLKQGLEFYSQLPSIAPQPKSLEYMRFRKQALYSHLLNGLSIRPNIHYILEC